MKKVVITGMGALTPFGIGVEKTWNSIISGESAIKRITKFDTENFAIKIAGEITKGTNNCTFSPDDFLDRKEQRTIDDFILYGIVAADEALKDAGLTNLNESEKEKTAVIIGSGIGGLSTIEKNAISLAQSGPRRVSPYFIPSCIINMISGHVSIRYGFKGENVSCVSACASGSHALIQAYRCIMMGDADIVVTGGTEASVCPLGISGFSQAKALACNYNDDPEHASRPWDIDRCGFVMSEGAGILILEDYDHAKARGAKIYAEFSGYGVSADAYHITSPSPDGSGAAIAMKQALKKSNFNFDEIDYINAHGTSTLIGDKMELEAIHSVFGENSKLSISSTKSSVGHMLGAAGAIEAIFSINAINYGIIPPTLNLLNPIEEAKNLKLTPLCAEKKKTYISMSNSFGFGGTNASLIFCKI